MGGVLDHYSPVFALHAVVNTEPRNCYNAISSSSSSKGIIATHSSELRWSSSGSNNVTNTSAAPLGRPVLHRPQQPAHNNSNNTLSTLATSLFGGLSLFGSSASPGSQETVGGGGGSNAAVAAAASASSDCRRRVPAASDTCKRIIKNALSRDLSVDTRYCRAGAAHVALLADTDDW